MREILRIQDKKKAGPATNIYRAHEVIGARGQATILLAEMTADGSVTAVCKFSRRLKLVDFHDSKKRIIANAETLLADFPIVRLLASKPSNRKGDTKLEIEFRDASGQTTWTAALELSVIEVALHADYNRDGEVDPQAAAAEPWNCGANGKGAVLLVNSDRDTSFPNRRFRDRLDHRVDGPMDLEDMTPMRLVLSGPAGLDLSDLTLRLHVSDAAVSRLRVFDLNETLPRVLVERGIPVAAWPAEFGRKDLAVEGLDYPDMGFSGLLTIHADLTSDSGVDVLATDTVVLRVAPWLALPNTQPVSRLFIAEMQDGSNRAAIDGIREVAEAARVALEVVPPKSNRRDRWLQDEIEIGFSSRPGKTLSVVLDSPRNRGLDDFPEEMLLGPDFAYVTRGNDEATTSLDSFGNLDCAPPHTGPNGSFPFGRLVFGGSQPGVQRARRLMKTVADFLYAQQVQRPIELYSDWLSVGHVDEFMSWIPANSGKGFRLVLASPELAYDILENLAAGGHGEAVFMPGKRHEHSVSELLADGKLRRQNDHFQRIIDGNRQILFEEMGLSVADIVHLPALYYADSPDGRAGAYFPGMVNMQVVNQHLAIPKPFGPVVDGECTFELAARESLEPLGLVCHFVDTYEGYHLLLGEIHCGTNVVREPFTEPWWETELVR